jgi:mono/diheme cytochrome c family protein/glucose/arabinose dehydrogenase
MIRPLLFLLLFLAGSGAAEPPWLHLPPAAGTANGKKVVLVSGDEEYRSEEALPMLAKILSQRHGFDCTVLFAINPETGFVDPNHQKNIPGLEHLAQADLLVIATRFRQLPDDQYRHLAAYLNQGKPVIGLRTATHAFTGNGQTDGFKWAQFGLLVLGEQWVAHHGKHKVEGARGVIVEEHKNHEVLRGVTDVFASSDVYTVKNLDETKATVLLRGAVTKSLDPASEILAEDPRNNPMQAFAWLKDYASPDGKSTGKAFTTTAGAAVDFLSDDLRRLVVNAALHLTGQPVPAKADVEFVDPFHPTFYGFIKADTDGEDYFRRRKLLPSMWKLGSSASTGLPAPKPPAPKPSAGLDAPPTYPQPPKAPDAALPTRLPLDPTPRETVAILGNALGERMDLFGHFETVLQRRFPDRQITVRNLSSSGDTPGFRAHPARVTPWAFPGAEKFHPDKQTHHGKGHYPTPDEWLTEVKADTILALFGFNESFDGPAHVDRFRAELAAFVDHTRSLAYNGKSAPRLVLVTPIAFEDRSTDFDLPDGQEANERLAAYAKAVLAVAAEKQVGAVDLFSLTRGWFAGGPPLTINGCHLSEAGDRRLAPELVAAIWGNAAPVSRAPYEDVRQAVLDKTWIWQNDYHILNGVHVYGQRWKPYGNVNYPEEIAKLRQMARLRDERVWATVVSGSPQPPADDSKTLALTPVETNYRAPIQYLDEAAALSKFHLPQGYQISLFASEATFPMLRNPVQMAFDNRGRLWVSTIDSYPHYRPGGPRPNDKLLILEDTDGDGRADRQTVFAEGLSLPIGFELAPEGVYVSEEPNLVLLKDTNGDDRADQKHVIVHGFDSHDTHHAISAYCADASGAFYLCEGRFLHSQVETPYGPQRMTDGGVWRFDPRTWRTERFSQSDYNNPWAVAFDDWGQNFLGDASGGDNWWLLPLSVKVPHGREIEKEGQFTTFKVRPTSGGEFVSSRHFPDEVQGDFLLNNTIGFLGTKQHTVREDGAGYTGELRQDLVSCDDPNFRPVDLEFAPDGSLYLVDWHNALVGHMQHSARDPNRSSDYGRIYRVTYPARPLVQPPHIAGAPLPVLLDNLKLHEYRARYRTRRELRGRPAAEVLPAVSAWAAALNPADPLHGRHLLEALWVGWGHGRIDPSLLTACQNHARHEVRAAAARVIRHDHARIPDAAERLLRAAADPHPRVRLEALVAASWLDNRDGARIAAKVMEKPIEKWMGAPMQAAMWTLEDDLRSAVQAKVLAANANPTLEGFLAGKVKFEPTIKPAPLPIVNVPAAALKLYEIGKEVYHREAHCVTCHQANGQGLPNIYPGLEKNEWVGGDDERLVKIVLKGLWGPITVNGQAFDPTKGVPPMTGFGGLLSDEEIAGVLTYVRYSFKNSYPAITPETVKRVREATKDRAAFYMVEEILKEHPFRSE